MKVVHYIVIFMITGAFMIIIMRRTLSYSNMTVSTITCNCRNVSGEPLEPPATIPSTSPKEFSQEANSISSEASSHIDNPTATSPKSSTFLLIMMPIRPNAFPKRKLIRSTWYRGYENSNEVMLRFVVGTTAIPEQISDQLREETSTYNDIVSIDQDDSSRALTNKTIAMMKWASDNVNFMYMMKCDDDTFVYVDNVINELKKRPTVTSLYYGKMMYDAPVMRNIKDKWADPHWDLGDTYMPYALGGGYILSSDLVVMLAEQADYLKWHLNEDTAVGSWLAPYEYERRSDDLVCVTDINGALKYKCVEKFPIFHIYYCFPQHLSEMSYFHKLYNEYMMTKKEMGT